MVVEPVEERPDRRIVRVLHVSPSFFPATYWGGPIFSTLNLCDGIAAEPGVAVTVLTTDAAGERVGDRVPDRSRCFPAGYQVSYSRRIIGRDVAPGMLARLLPAVARADVVHLTATYSFPTLPTLFACKLLGRPVVWSPRGAVQARMEWKGAENRAKAAFERVARVLAPKNTVLHATSQIEAELTQAAMPGLALRVIANSIEIPAEPSDTVRTGPGRWPLRLLFLSRLHEKKGLEMLLQALPSLPDATLTICGEGTQDYLAHLFRLVAELQLEGRVTFFGHVDAAARDRAYRSADVFVLPSHSENFGNVVAEALAYGVPVVSTTATPWAALEDQRCGRWVAPTTEAIREAIASLSSCDLAAMGRRGRAFVIEQYSQKRIAKDMVALYRELAGSQALPGPGTLR